MTAQIIPSRTAAETALAEAFDAAKAGLPGTRDVAKMRETPSPPSLARACRIGASNPGITPICARSCARRCRSRRADAGGVDALRKEIAGRCRRKAWCSSMVFRAGIVGRVAGGRERDLACRGAGARAPGD